VAESVSYASHDIPFQSTSQLVKFVIPYMSLRLTGG